VELIVRFYGNKVEKLRIKIYLEVLSIYDYNLLKFLFFILLYIFFILDLDEKFYFSFMIKE